MKLKCVINLFSGPCAGKSMISSGLFYEMKKLGLEVEMVHEYAKDLTYEQRNNVLTADQLYIFAKQHRKIFRLKDAVEYIIADSPLLLSSIYFSQNLNIYNPDIFHSLVKDTFNKYPNYNIFLERNPLFEYQQFGRNQTLEESIDIDNSLKYFLLKNQIEVDNYISDEFTIQNILNSLKERNLL